MGRISKTLAIIIYLFFLLCISIQPFTAAAQETSIWNTQLIDKNAARGYIAIATDSNNLAHIAYANYENVRSDSPIDIVYASFNGTEWNTQVVNQGKGKIDLALDSSDNAHLIFNSYHTDDLMYTNWNGNNWTIQTVDKNGGWGSLKLDSEGNPHIAYTFFGELKYASLVGSYWNIQTIDSSRYELLNYGASLCLDKNDTPHILYSFTTGQTSNNISTIKYAYLQNNGWNIQTVASKDDLGLGNLVLDSAGNPHFTYPQGHPQSTYSHVTITHLFLNDSHWDSDIVANNIMLQGSGYLTIGANDTMYANFLTYNYPNNDRFLQLAKLTDGKWNTEIVVNGSAMMGFSPFAADSKGNLHVAYIDVNSNSTSYNGYLYYATNSIQSTGIPLIEPSQTVLIIAVISAVVLISCLVVGILLFSRHRMRRTVADEP
jgi:hypothetical protein